MKDDRTDLLGTRSVAVLLKEYSIPAIVGTTVMIVYNIVDRIFIGQGVGPYALSGLALTLPIAALQTAFGTLIGVGAAARTSIVLGMRDREWAERILAHAFVLSIAFSLLFTVLMQVFMPEILALMGGTDQTIPYALEYMRIVNAGSVLTTLTYSFGNVMRASGYPKKSMNVMIIGALVNTVLDPFFIFVLDMGIRGAAVATVISMLVTSVIVVVHYINPNSYIRFRRKAFKFDPKVVRNIFAIGLSPFIMNLMVSLVNTLINNALVEHGGDLAIGAYGIIGSFTTLIVMIMMGVSQGMQPILGYNFGANNYERLSQTLTLGIKVGFCITTVGFLFAEFVPQIIVSCFTQDNHLSSIAERGMRILMAMFPLVGIQIVIATFFQSIGWVKSAIALTLTRQLIFLIPCVLILPGFYGLDGVWLASPVSDLLSFVVAVVVLSIQRKKLIGTISDTLIDGR